MPRRLDDPIPIQWFEWKFADIRLDLMEEGARAMLKGGYAEARIVVEQRPAPETPLILPGSPAFSMLLGPDGKPIGGSPSSP